MQEAEGWTPVCDTRLVGPLYQPLSAHRILQCRQNPSPVVQLETARLEVPKRLT